LHWIRGEGDDAGDLCAHGDVEFRVGEEILLDETGGRDITVSAAALYLLRTLSAPHTKQKPVAEHLFPHCGFEMWDITGQEDVFIRGCAVGVDFEVLHEGEDVVVRSEQAREYKIGRQAWHDAVFAFADQVSNFYAASSPRQLPSDDEEGRGFRKFITEWERRRGKSFGLSGSCVNC
jgi:hypothetical protein